MNIYQQFIHKSRYAKWINGKRENWNETVRRYINFIKRDIPVDWLKIEQKILNMEVMPSMRALMSAGTAADRDNASIYNCSYLEISYPKAFSEAMYLLMNGVGVGFSVEKRCIEQLPICEPLNKQLSTFIIVEDSRIGWCEAFSKLISNLYKGIIPFIDYSKIRPAGTPLKTFGGRASGPFVLRDLFEFVIKIFDNAINRKLTPVECYDIMCYLASIILCGGARRSAMICLFDTEEMYLVKTGDWYKKYPYRALANNSIVFNKKPTAEEFMKYFATLIKSKCGEPGFFNREAARDRRGSEYLGINPCGEVILRNNEFCNLTEVVCRENDNKETLLGKLEIAAILGTIQATYTDFVFLNKNWQINCENNRLLGVSLTGIFDCPYLLSCSDNDLIDLKMKVVETNKKVANLLNINSSNWCCTSIKPSGTVSQLVDSSSGIHPRFAEYYIRAIRGSNKDPIYKFMQNIGVKSEVDKNDPENTIVLYFPIKSPTEIKKLDIIDYLNFYKKFINNYVQHNASCTVEVGENDWVKVINWVYENFDELIGLTFLPKKDTIYEQMPFTKCTKEEYEELLKITPKTIDWSELDKIEINEYTPQHYELACKAGYCDI